MLLSGDVVENLGTHQSLNVSLHGAPYQARSVTVSCMQIMASVLHAWQRLSRGRRCADAALDRQLSVQTVRRGVLALVVTAWRSESCAARRRRHHAARRAELRAARTQTQVMQQWRDYAVARAASSARTVGTFARRRAHLRAQYALHVWRAHVEEGHAREARLRRVRARRSLRGWVTATWVAAAARSEARAMATRQQHRHLGCVLLAWAQAADAASATRLRARAVQDAARRTTARCALAKWHTHTARGLSEEQKALVATRHYLHGLLGRAVLTWHGLVLDRRRRESVAEAKHARRHAQLRTRVFYGWRAGRLARQRQRIALAGAASHVARADLPWCRLQT